MGWRAKWSWIISESLECPVKARQHPHIKVIILSRNYKTISLFCWPRLIAKNIDAASYTDVNANAAALKFPPTDAEFVSGLNKTKDVSDDDNSVDFENEAEKCPDRKEPLKVVKK